MENVDGAQLATLVTMALPRFMVLKSIYNSKYLNYINEEGETHAFLKFSGEDALSPLAKFELEPAAQSGSGQLFHIRSCYNNKYWRMKADGDWYVDAVGDQPEEDRSKWSCTLFEAISVDETAQTWRFRHAFRGGYACLWRAEEPRWACLYAGYSDTNSDLCDVYTIIDWETLLILPKHVAFKGANGKYLKSWSWPMGQTHDYLKFYGDDIGDEMVGNEIFTNGDGTIRIKSDHFGKFWRQSPYWIWTDSADTTSNNKDTLFLPVKVDNGTIALRNLGNNFFCKMSKDYGSYVTSCLVAEVPTICKEARLIVEELVVSRTISNARYRVNDARIYNQTVLLLGQATATNSTQEPNTLTLRIKYSDITTKNWSNGESLTFAMKSGFQIGQPKILEGNISIGVGMTEIKEWGKTKSEKTQAEYTYSTTVEPMSTVLVNLVASQGTCDVPFSYSQTDTLINGERVDQIKHDGLYTGSNYFNLRIDSEKKTRLALID